MKDPASRQERRRHRWGVARLAASLLVLAGVTGSALAVEFDEKLKAPAMKSAADLRQQSQGFATNYRALLENAPERVIRDPAVARQQFDLRWQAQSAIDAGKPVDELADVGIRRLDDGSYDIDLRGHPQWFQLHRVMAFELPRIDLAAARAAFIGAGFRPEDVDTLRDYIATHQVERQIAQDSLSLTLGFARAVRKYDRIGRPVPDALVQSYLYQRQLVTSESNRRWVDGLFQRLDAQRQRILCALYSEEKGMQVWWPEDIDVGIRQLLDAVRQPDFEARVTAEAKGIAP